MISFFSQGLLSGSGHFSPRHRNRESAGLSPPLTKSRIPTMEKQVTSHEDDDKCHIIICEVLSTLYKILEQVERLRLPFRDLLRLSGVVKLGEAPKCFDLATTQAVNRMAQNPHVQAIAQAV